jgi:FMN-dependent dehydrogenase
VASNSNVLPRRTYRRQASATRIAAGQIRVYQRRARIQTRAARGIIALGVIACIEDLRLLAQRRVPRMFYDYVDSGSWTESTYRANEADLAAICFRQRVASNIENRSIRSTMIGEDVAMPVALAPTGLCGMQHADGVFARSACAGCRFCRGWPMPCRCRAFLRVRFFGFDTLSCFTCQSS